MCTKWTRASLLIAMLAGGAAWADGNQKGGADPATKTLPATASDTAKANAFGQKAASSQKGGADPSSKTLPASASDPAKANAFGAQGARSKAAHQAAHAAATQAAHAAVDQVQAAPGAGAARPAAAATTHASTTGVTNGFDRAAAGAANGQGSTHRH